ncbi:lipopolysaccharide biosynthesis protein [Flavobacteriaceae bacterium R38]|nr:lipopolysaccharide biosynthesis protein [Flavobacteriaceae bacterium R38]
MGIIINQSFKNTITTYLGFAFGAVNTIFLYSYFLAEDYYGLVIFILSAANVIMPLLTFGVHNTMVKFFSSYTDKKEQAKFTTLMFFLPIFIIIPVGIIGVLVYENVVLFLTQKNALVENYVWMIYAVAIAMAYFEVFFSWAKVHLKTVFGNFLKEVFHRVVVMILLFALYLDFLDVETFIIALVIMYILRMMLMMASCLIIKKPQLKFSLPFNTITVLKYSSLIILAGSVANVLLEIDKVMLNQYLTIENIAFYSVAVFIAMVIVVPARAMHQIIYPITADLMNKKDHIALGDLYKRSSSALFVIGGGIFLLIVLNINELYKMLPEGYSSAVVVVYLIAAAKLSDTLLGNNNSIIFNSEYYRMILLFGVLLTVLTIVLNLLLIPVWGLNGAAIASLTSFLIYNSLKIWFVYYKFKIHPFNGDTIKVGGVLIVFLGVFCFWNFSFHPILNIGLKSVLIGIGYLFVIHKFSLSKDVSGLIMRFLK